MIQFIGKCEYVGCENGASVHQTKPFDAVLCRQHAPTTSKALVGQTVTIRVTDNGGQKE